MTPTHQGTDGGFVLLDALIAAAIVALAVVATLRLIAPIVDRSREDALREELLQSARGAIVHVRAGLDLPENTARIQFSRRERQSEEGLYVTVAAMASVGSEPRTVSLTTLLPRVRYAPPR